MGLKINSRKIWIFVQFTNITTRIMFIKFYNIKSISFNYVRTLLIILKINEMCNISQILKRKMAAVHHIKDGRRRPYSAFLPFNSKKQNEMPNIAARNCHNSYMEFRQEVWSSLCCWQKHIDVQLNCDLRHLHRRDLHCVLQPQEITSRQLSGTGLTDIRIGFSPVSSRFQPISWGEGRLGMEQAASFHIIHW